ncbi:hypothetical protein ACFFX0_10940 [Citricoccus parietis]|uniref:Uncharacterized protein n=1 Tax=Citricoccus parietis TaxID=592307 RepID=A0ABV5FYE9_9MICC
MPRAAPDASTSAPATSPWSLRPRKRRGSNPWVRRSTRTVSASASPPTTSRTGSLTPARKASGTRTS